MSFKQFVLRKEYQKVHGLGDRLGHLKGLVNWERFRPFFANLFLDDDKIGGRPHTDEVVMMRVLILQRLYGLSDQETEFQINDRTSFKNFLGFPEKLPDYTTIWRLKERMQQDGTLERIWNELQRQLNANGLKVKTGVIQDATFIEADLGKKRYHRETHAKTHGEEIAYTDRQRAHMDHDGTFAVKNDTVHFGYKLHQKSDVDFGLIRAFDVTTASTHDSQVDLTNSNDPPAYRDKGYAGVTPNAKVDRTMKKAARNRPLTLQEKRFNRNVSKIRAQGERPFAVIRRVFHGCTTRVKNLARVTVEQMMECFTFNLYQLFTLKRHGRF